MTRAQRRSMTASRLHSRRQARLSIPFPDFLSGLADYVQADGVASYSAGEVNLLGLTPTPEEFLQLVKFLNTTAAGRVFATHNLGDVFYPARDFVMRSAGILSIPISRTPRDYLVFFRKEAVQTVIWAGQPAKEETLGTAGPTLSPRKSFVAWREIVQGQSSRWSKRELRGGRGLAPDIDRVGASAHRYGAE